MFEKIFALLLRLYPSRFRKEYASDALQILRDRLRDERGFFKRAQLAWDLVADGFLGLPQAYRNSYPPLEAAALAFDAEGIPSFSVLASQPISRGSFLLGGALSLATVVAFGWLLNRSLNHKSVPNWNGRISPIEAVVERLNNGASTEIPDRKLKQSLVARSVAQSEPSVQNRVPAPQVQPTRADQGLEIAERQDRVVSWESQKSPFGSVPPTSRLAVGEEVAWNGILTDGSGRPLQSADIHVVGGTGELVTRTAENGSFTFSALPSGDYEVVIVLDGREVAYRKTHLSAISAPPRLTLASGGRLLLSNR